jgi:hypothetical protein
MLVSYQPRRHHIPGDCSLHIYCHGSLRSHVTVSGLWWTYWEPVTSQLTTFIWCRLLICELKQHHSLCYWQHNYSFLLCQVIILCVLCSRYRKWTHNRETVPLRLDVPFSKTAQSSSMECGTRSIHFIKYEKYICTQHF